MLRVLWVRRIRLGVETPPVMITVLMGLAFAAALESQSQWIAGWSLSGPAGSVPTTCQKVGHRHGMIKFRVRLASTYSLFPQGDVHDMKGPRIDPGQRGS